MGFESHRATDPEVLCAGAPAIWAVALALTVTLCSSVLATRSPKRRVLLHEVQPFRVTMVRPLLSGLGVTADARHHHRVRVAGSTRRAG